MKIHLCIVALTFYWLLQSSDAALKKKKKRKRQGINDSSNVTISLNAFVEVESTDANVTISPPSTNEIESESTDANVEVEPFIQDPMNEASSREEFLTLFEEGGTYSGDVTLTMVNSWLSNTFGVYLSIYESDLDGPTPIRHVISMETTESIGNPLNILYNGVNHYESFEFVDIDSSLLGFQSYESVHPNVIEDHGTMYFLSTGDSSVTIASVIRNEADGDCLFHSISSSLSARGIVGVDDIRTSVASYIRNNMDEFISQDDPTLGTFEEWIDMTIDNARVEAEAHRRAVAEAAKAAAAAAAAADGSHNNVVTSSSSDDSSSSSSSSSLLLDSPPSNSTDLGLISGINDITAQDAELILRERTNEPPLSYPKIADLIGRGCTGGIVSNYANKKLKNKLPSRKAGKVATKVFSKEDDDIIVKAYNSGMAISEIARQLSTTEPIINHRLPMLKGLDKKARLRGTTRTYSFEDLSPSDIAAIKKSYATGGKTMDDLAQQYDTNLSIVRKALGKKECRNDGCTKYSTTDGGFCSTCAKEFDIEGYIRFREVDNSNLRLRFANDPPYRLRRILRSRLARELSNIGIKTHGKAASIGGRCTSGQLSRFIAQRFRDWMNWGNQGMYDPNEYANGIRRWQLDHTYPLAPFVTEKNIRLIGLEEVMRRANHWSNLEPMCAKKNNEKGDTIPEGFYWDVKRDRWLWKPWTGKTNWNLPSVEPDNDDDDEDDEE